MVTPEIILNLGAEEGTITLYGVHLNDDWHFLLKYDKSVSNSNSQDKKDLLIETTSSRRGFNKAIELLDEYPWYMLIPRLIHPEFAELILSEVESRFQTEHFRLTYWRRLAARSIRSKQMVH